MQERGDSFQNINMLQYTHKQYQQYVKDVAHRKVLSITDFNHSGQIENENLREILPTKVLLIDIIQDSIPQCQKSDALKICNKLSDTHNISLDLFEANIQNLHRRQIGIETIIENPFLLVQRFGIIYL